MVKFFLGLMIVVALSGCGSLSTSKGHWGNLAKDGTVGVSTLMNLTETPMAGNRAASLINAVLIQRGYKTVLLDTAMADNDAMSEIALSERLLKAKNHGVMFLLVGEVIEWRYKTGIDGEPAITLVMRVYNTETSEVVYSANGSKSALGYSSLGFVANELIQSMLP